MKRIFSICCYILLIAIIPSCDVMFEGFDKDKPDENLCQNKYDARQNSDGIPYTEEEIKNHFTSSSDDNGNSQIAMTYSIDKACIGTTATVNFTVVANAIFFPGKENRPKVSYIIFYGKTKTNGDINFVEKDNTFIYKKSVQVPVKKENGKYENHAGVFAQLTTSVPGIGIEQCFESILENYIINIEFTY